MAEAKRVGFWLRFPLLVLLVGVAIRIFCIATISGEVPGWVWWLGLLSDLSALGLLLGLIGLAMLTGRDGVVRFAVGLAIAILLLVSAAEVFFWQEFEGRLNRLVFHYLKYPVEVLAFLDEQLYLSWLALPFLVVVWLIQLSVGQPSAARSGGVVCVLAMIAVLLFSRQPVVSGSAHLNQAASNGFVGVLTAATIDVSDWHALYGRVQPGPYQVSERAEPVEAPLRGQHVVLIIEESFAGTAWTDPERRRQIMPNFSALAEQGVVFEQAYSTGSRTTRGMEGVLNGVSPLPGIALIERSGFDKLPSLASAYADNGYHTIFAYGGWRDFSNFTNYWRATGFAETTDRTHFPEGTFETSWGVDDDALFNHVLELMDARTQAGPTFLATLTVSHHRPYILPPGVTTDFPTRTSDSALQYADASLGRFFDAAQSRTWFEDTLFVVVADHAPRIEGAALIPLASFRVPLLFLHADLPAEVVTRDASIMSLPRTLARLSGLQHEQTFDGLDLFVPQAGPVPIEYNYHLGWLDGGTFTVLARGGETYAWTEAGQPTAVDEGMLTDLRGYFYGAHAAYYSRF